MRRRRQFQNFQPRISKRTVVKNVEAPTHPNTPRDEHVMALEAGLIQGTVSVVQISVPLASLRAHHPQSLHRARASLRDEPALHAAIVQRVLTGGLVWHVYRDESGGLVMYDDYAAYVVSQELGRETVDVKILGSTAA